MKRSLFMILSIFTLTAVIYPQVSQQWVQRYNGSGNANDESVKLVTDASGNIYLTGRSVGTGNNTDIVTVKYNSAGVQQWLKRVNGALNRDDGPSSITLDNIGNVIITGVTNYISTPDGYYFIMKYNSNGDSLWALNLHPASVYNVCADVIVDAAGNIYTTGVICGVPTGCDAYTLKLNPAGIQQWAQIYSPTNGNDAAFSIGLDGSNNVYITGDLNGFRHPIDVATIKYSNSGSQQWAQTYNAPQNKKDQGYYIATDLSGNSYIAALFNADSIMVDGPLVNGDFGVLKYNTAGALQWSRIYSGPGIRTDEVTGIEYDVSGNVYVTGKSMAANGKFDFVTIKYSSTGDSLWVKRFNGTGDNHDFPNAMVLDNLGNVYVSGTTNAVDSTGFRGDFCTIKYNSSGVQQWLMTYNGPVDSTDIVYSISLDTLNSVIVTGSSKGLGSGLDMTTIKYSQPVGIEPVTGVVPTTYKLSQNYPNPFNPVTVINFEIPKQSFTILTVYDIVGKEVASLVNQQLLPGGYNVTFEAGSFGSGIYFYRITSDDFTETKRMVLVK